MPRIITSFQLAAETGAAYILELEGRLQGDRVEELRRAWRSLRDAVAGVPICVVLGEVEFVDAAGKVLLAEMHCTGVELLAREEGHPSTGVLVRTARDREFPISNSARVPGSVDGLFA